MTFFEVEKNKLIIVILKKKVLIFCAQRDILEECAVYLHAIQKQTKTPKNRINIEGNSYCGINTVCNW